MNGTTKWVGWTLVMVFLVIGLAIVSHLQVEAQTSGVAAIRTVKRVGMVIQINPEKMAEYKRLHADENFGVRDLLNKYHMHNFSIFLQQIEGKWYEFGYYEYTGDDFEGDMATMDKEQRNIDWLKICDPMQIPLEGATGWSKMEMVYHND